MTGPTGSDVVVLQVIADVDDDEEQLRELTGILQEDLSELDVRSVEPLAEDMAPEGSKGIFLAMAGWLSVHLGTEGLKAVVNAVSAWAGRTGRTVELTLDGNTLKLTGASAELESRIVNEFFSRQAPPH
ncbi:hypothetical protein Rai3103_10690 [Raineyella fluvialis]|uniref:Uncharacterized protein n=2 Tax=Raineyella fluvialis TaxID=2662261 RepID=A0A5Q2FAQ4_9ACTN|nr:hypothetical protein Rai3103_10690 [Raineyella fluvialis]